jgi:hypothetical protein
VYRISSTKEQKRLKSLSHQSTSATDNDRFNSMKELGKVLLIALIRYSSPPIIQKRNVWQIVTFHIAETGGVCLPRRFNAGTSKYLQKSSSSDPTKELIAATSH